MARARFDKQLRKVFTFITGLTVVVGVVAILSNRYLVDNHRALIQDNLPTAALTRQIQADSAYVASLAGAFTDVGSAADLTALSDELTARVVALGEKVDDLAARAPGRVGPAPPAFSELEEAVKVPAQAALARIEARDAVAGRLADIGAKLSELEDIAARETDTARVQVTATIADLYDVDPEALPERLDQLADDNFFVYDRLFELSRAIEATRTAFEKTDNVATHEALVALEDDVGDAVATAQSRTSYLPSAGARAQADRLLGDVARERAPDGVFSVRSRGLAAGATLETALSALQTLTDTLVAYANAQFERMQAKAEASQANTERLSWWITLGLVAVLAAAVVAAVVAYLVVSRSTVSRLTDVSRHIIALARGDYDRNIPETGDDEIGRMEKALHVLRLRAAEARRLRDQLEEAVTQRTRDVVTEMHAHDRARGEAEAANRAKSEFLAMMGHEIRTPLNGVVGMLRLLEQEAASPPERNRATIARQSAENLLVLSNDILDYAATQDHRPALDPVHFDLRELMGQMIGYLRANAEEKGLVAAVDMEPDVPPVLFGDVQKVRQILVNLLSNAVKYTDTGQVTFLLDHAADPDTGQPLLSFSVTDTGAGIAPGDQARVFDAYARGPGGASDGIEGLGLGLSICRRLTEVLGGALTLESTPGTGSRFTLTVPVDIGDPEQVVRQSEKMQPAQLRRRVLVVEDQPVNRMVARGYLERLGCSVTEAETGADGVQIACEGGIDFILMDLDLPDMSGGAAAAAIRAALESPPPIAALTAHRIEDTATKRADLSVDHILHKPLSPRALAELLGADAGVPERAVPQGIRDALASDIDDIGPGETASIVAAFIDEVDPALATMQAALAASDMEGIARQAHRLKGAASNFALTALCEQLARIENAARHDRDVSGAMAGVETLGAQAAACLRAAAHDLGLQLPSGSTSK